MTQAPGTDAQLVAQLYGNEDQSHVTINGRKVYIYKILPSQVDGTSETIPFRVQFKDESGNVMDNTDFVASVTDQFRQFKVNAYAGGLDVSKLRITATVDGDYLPPGKAWLEHPHDPRQHR